MPPKRLPQKKSAPPKKASSSRGGAKKSGAATAAAAGSAAVLRPQIVTKLEQNDVLMGRGALATDYEGNLRLREIVQSRHAEYSAVFRDERHRIAQEVVQAVKERGGRFLQGADTLKGIDPSSLPRYEAAWYVVEDKAVLLAKVKQLFRDTKPKPKAALPRQDEDSKQSAVLVTGANTVGPTGTGMQPPGMNFLWQQQFQHPQQAHARVASQPSGSSQHSTAPSTASFQPRQSDENSVGSGSSSLNEGSQSSSIDQHQVGISTSTSLLGQDNASAVLQVLTAANSPQDQQYDALLALSLASRVQPRNSTAPVSEHQPTGPTRSERNRILEILAAKLIEDNQRRERERSLAGALLAHLLPCIVEQQAPAAVAAAPPPSAPSSSIDPSMNWLFNQLQGRQSQPNTAAAPSASSPAEPMYASSAPPAPVSAAQTFPDLAALLRGEQAAPRETGLLEQPSRLIELERLLLPPDRWSRNTSSAQSNTASRRNPEDALAQLLRSLQRQYFRPPPS